MTKEQRPIYRFLSTWVTPIEISSPPDDSEAIRQARERLDRVEETLRQRAAATTAPTFPFALRKTQ